MPKYLTGSSLYSGRGKIENGEQHRVDTDQGSAGALVRHYSGMSPPALDL
jgi:hypothetical protein